MRALSRRSAAVSLLPPLCLCATIEAHANYLARRRARVARIVVPIPKRFYMKYTRKLLSLGILAALAMSAAYARGVSPVVRGHAPSVSFAPNGTEPILYDQTETCTLGGVLSQIFDDSHSQYDSSAADDFIVPSGTTWDVAYLSVGGNYYDTGVGPAPFLSVTFYDDNHGVPGEEVTGCEYSNITTFTDASGAFGISLPTPCALVADAVEDTTFWVSVRAQMDYDVGLWAWNGNSTLTGDISVFENPLNGFGLGCTDWTSVESCFGGTDPDRCFALAGAAGANLGDEGIFADGFDVSSLEETFDEVTPPALPAGWVASTDTGNPWTTVTLNAYAGSNAAYADDPGIISDKSLVSPLFIESGAGTFAFHQDVELEDTYDGAVLEISINGSPFTDILDAGGSFTSGGYNNTISVCCGSPLAGRPAWSGSSGGYHYVTGTLPSGAVGNTVKLRWRVGSDDSNSGQGYWLDSVIVN